MKKTAFYDIHLNLGAKMTAFAGYEMPVQYTGVTKEHLAVRDSVGVFDVSHMGEFIVEGKGAQAFLQYVCSNDISKLTPGKAQYNFLPNGKGGVVDDLIVYQLDENRYLLVVNAGNIQKDWDWLHQHSKNFEITLEDQSDTTSLLAIQGPHALKAMQSLTDISLNTLPFYGHATGTFANYPNVLVATTGYTGAGGIEIYFPKKNSTAIWNAVMESGKDFGIVPVGLAARDTLRLEMGYCLYGNELNDTTSPIAAGLGWVAKPETECIDAETLQIDKREGTRQKLVGFIVQERGIPRKDYAIKDMADRLVGYVTSGTQSPSLSKGIGLAYVDTQVLSQNTALFVSIRNKNLPIDIVKTPFI